jgi:hypothetical protein
MQAVAAAVLMVHLQAAVQVVAARAVEQVALQRLVEQTQVVAEVVAVALKTTHNPAFPVL